MTGPAPRNLPSWPEREALNAGLFADNTETGFFDDLGRPVPWPDDIENWTLDACQHDHDSAQPPF
ncbi:MULTISPECIES: hypothetical protein [Catenuloplanes]|uniref:Uncharacterized protein n=2 Tax=Catenuloplanes TaxID=33874 RepID=A0AAE4CTC8_9ACTN|nr:MULTISPECIES: hypothetical protein [Catenuloplanes]MDQ0365104.1 hypothetical protein [Catenuloplanes indicus]MDR7322153.1 hypothetical protein [Catenuloplanes niger]